MTDTVTVRRDALRELFWEAHNRGWLAEPLKSFRGVDAEIDDRLAAMLVSPWQPIETAPRDGTEILAVDTSEPSGMVYLVCWDAESAFDTHPWQDARSERYRYAHQAFTHWQPLSEPPK
jgi:hypothetical protein